MTIGGNLLTLEYDETVDDPTICERIPVQGDLIRELTWDGTQLWSFDYASSTFLHHHDVEPLPARVDPPA